MRFKGTVEFCLQKGEYDQGDVCLIEYDDLYNHVKDLEHQLAEIKKVCENFDGSTVYLTSILPQIERILNNN